MHRLVNVVAAVAGILLLPSIVFAQATIAGVVRDVSAAVLPGVTVEASSPVLIEKTRTVVSDGTGQYRMTDLLPGTYVLTFTLPGFTTVKRDSVVVSGSGVTTINAELRVGALEETITVSGETPVVNKHFFEPGTDVTDWHVYSVDWTPQELLFRVDGRLTYRATRTMIEHYGKWVFDEPEFIILNFAVGGIYPFKTNGIRKPFFGLSESTTQRIKDGEIKMLVDWVKVTKN